MLTEKNIFYIFKLKLFFNYMYYICRRNDESEDEDSTLHLSYVSSKLHCSLLYLKSNHYLPRQLVKNTHADEHTISSTPYTVSLVFPF